MSDGELRYTKLGRLDMRTKAARKRAETLPVHEIEGMLRIVYPGLQAVARQYADASKRIVEFRAAHPELAAMERAAMDAMEANNQAVLPVWGLLAKLHEQDEEKWREWCAFLNGEGPEPGRKE